MPKLPDVPLTEEELIDMYQKMLTIRMFEEKAYELFTKGYIPGAIHSSVGQEAVAVGGIAAIRKEDYVLGSHRGHGHCIAKGGDPKRMMAELFGKATGYCKGKGGSMHITDPKVGHLGAISIVGAQIPIAVGVGLSIKLRKTDQVCLCFFGDGAANQGTFHEGLNLASLWKLPVIFICENNLYAVTVHVSKSTSVENIAQRAVAYNMPGVVVDGMDVIAVYKAASEAVKKARNREGPTLIECKTYRYYGHSRGDPPYGPYRKKEEWEEWKRRDPIPRFRSILIEKNVLTEEDDKRIQQNVVNLIEEAVKFAFESPNPSPEDAFKDIYV